jgi:hypothetical protein
MVKLFTIEGDLEEEIFFENSCRVLSRVLRKKSLLERILEYIGIIK